MKTYRYIVSIYDLENVHVVTVGGNVLSEIWEDATAIYDRETSTPTLAPPPAETESDPPPSK